LRERARAIVARMEEEVAEAGLRPGEVGA
jgi:hypothetical protein